MQRRELSLNPSAPHAALWAISARRSGGRTSARLAPPIFPAFCFPFLHAAILMLSTLMNMLDSATLSSILP